MILLTFLVLYCLIAILPMKMIDKTGPNQGKKDRDKGKILSCVRSSDAHFTQNRLSSVKAKNYPDIVIVKINSSNFLMAQKRKKFSKMNIMQCRYLPVTNKKFSRKLVRFFLKSDTKSKNHNRNNETKSNFCGKIWFVVRRSAKSAKKIVKMFLVFSCKRSLIFSLN